MNIILLGIQGAGKSTQGNLLSSELKIPYLSTGHIFRQISKEKTKLGRTVKELINSGNLVPDEITLEIVNEYLVRPEYKNGFILDGFPRTIKQAKECKFQIDKVIYLELDPKEALWRIVMRHESRDDNTVQAVQHRVDLFYKHTKPVIEYYEEKGILATVDAVLSPKAVSNEILKSIGKQLIKKHVTSWKQKNPIIIATVGLSGSGKTEAVNYLAKTYKLPIVSFSNVVNDYMDENKIEHTVENHQKVRNEIRAKHGMATMAILRENDLKNALKKSNIVLIEGLYSWEEYEYLLKHFHNVRVELVAIWASKHLRWSSAARREYRQKFHGAKEILQSFLKRTKAQLLHTADYLIKNNFSMDEFHDKLDETYRSIIFS
ncbi:MAG: nucleoside monophosphate kinase [Patescibacteria group bacterium]